jgi:hypothetical protein
VHESPFSGAFEAKICLPSAWSELLAFGYAEWPWLPAPSENPAKGRTISYRATIVDKRGNQSTVALYDVHYGK